MSDEPCYSVLAARGVLAIEGDDRVAFLQGLVSNDMTKVGPTRALYAALLTPQGKYLHDFFVAAEGDRLFIDAEAARLDDLARRLRQYKLRSKVTIADACASRMIVAAFGPGVAARFGLAPETGAARAWGDGVAFVDPRLAALGLRLIVPDASTVEALGLAPANADDYDRMRLAHGVPDGSRDLAIEKSVLLEAGFDELNGVDWRKGCYVGQELTARTHYRGLVKRRLMPVAIDGPTPAPDTAVMLGASEAGEMRSARDRRGIALLRLEAVAAAARDHMPFTAGAAKLTPIQPDWMKLD